MGAAVVLLLTTPVLAAGQAFMAELDPVPFDASNRAKVINAEGTVSAVLDGNTLRISGNFSKLTSPATDASLRLSAAMGVPGDAIGKLSVAHDKEGTISGSVALNDAQVAALKKQSLYIRIDSEKAPDGHLQGWLEPKGK